MNSTTIVRFIIACLIIFSVEVAAQTYELGPAVKTRTLTPFSRIMGCYDDFYYAARIKFKVAALDGIQLEKYNYQHELQSTSILELDRSQNFNSLIHFQDKMYLCYRIENDAISEMEYYLQAISQKTGHLESEKIKAGHHPIHRADIGNKTRPHSSNKKVGYLNSTISPDKNFMAMITSEKDFTSFTDAGEHYSTNINTYDYNTIHAHIFDASMNEVWSKRIKIPHKSKFLQILSYSSFGSKMK